MKNAVEVPVVPEDLVVAGPRGALDALMRHQVEIPLGGMVDALVHHSPGQSVPILVFVVVSREKPSNTPWRTIISKITGTHLV